MLNNIEFGIGIIKYNEFNINFDIELEQQEDSLTEDLLQVQYPENYLIDLGWYPECNAKGNFVLNVIHNYDWDHPVLKKVINSNKKSVDNALIESITLVEELIQQR